VKLKSFDRMNCSLEQTLDVIGERWTLLLLRDAFFGIRRFDQFQRDLGIARNILAAKPIAPMAVRSHDGRALGPGDIKAVPGPALQRSRKRRSSKTKKLRGKRCVYARPPHAPGPFLPGSNRRLHDRSMLLLPSSFFISFHRYHKAKTAGM
jgi:hypothetical protein